MIRFAHHCGETAFVAIFLQDPSGPAPKNMVKVRSIYDELSRPSFVSVLIHDIIILLGA